MSPAAALLAGVGLILLGGLTSLSLAKAPRAADRIMTVLVVAGLAACTGVGIRALLGGTPTTAALQPAVPGGPWAILVDPLAGWFLVLLGLAGAAATIYGVRYLAPERAHRPVALAHALFALLLAAMVVVVIAHAAVLFLVAWETMAVSAYLLIMFEGERPEVRRSGLIYLVLTHTGTLALIAMFLIWGRGGADFTFETLAAAAPAVPWSGGLVLLLALFGFGVKAGVVPLHFWLPGAHAAAPSHVSAILSGVMLKMGIYGLLRVMSLLGGSPVWFGWVLFALGICSGVLGVLWALGQHDLKRVLAYSSVENVGIILMGMGVGVLGIGYGQPLVAALGFAAAVLHSLNHALFKSLLFLGAGAVLRATGTRELDRLGGLGRRMPITAAIFGMGAIAIVGLPPLNGFIGEWVAVQGLLSGAEASGAISLMALGLAALGLIGALALACFTRVVGATFLGQARTGEAAGQDDWGLLVPMLGLLAICVVIGGIPVLAVRPASLVVQGLLRASGALGSGAYSMLAEAVPRVGGLFAFLATVAVVIWYLRRWAGRPGVAATGPTWGCGYARPAPRMQYSASSFSAPVLKAFGPIAAPRVIRVAGSLATDPADRIHTGIVLPLWARARAAAGALRPLQQGRVTRYLQYMVLTVLILLGALFAAIARKP